MNGFGTSEQVGNDGESPQGGRRSSVDGVAPRAADAPPVALGLGDEPGQATTMPMPMPGDVCPLCNGRGCETCRDRR